MSKYRKGARVSWKWASGTASGKITESFTDDVERTIKGAKIKRKASIAKPAYLIEQDDGDKVLKGHSELTKAS